MEERKRKRKEEKRRKRQRRRGKRGGRAARKSVMDVQVLRDVFFATIYAETKVT